MSYDGRVGAMAATLPVDLTLSVLPVLRLTAGAHRPTTKTTHRQTYTNTYRQTDDRCPQTYQRLCTYTYMHATTLTVQLLLHQTRLMASFPGQPGTRKVNQSGFK